MLGEVAERRQDHFAYFQRSQPDQLKGNAHFTFEMGLVSRGNAGPHGVRNCTRDEEGPFEVGNRVLILSHRKLRSSKATVVNVAERSRRDFDRYD